MHPHIYPGMCAPTHIHTYNQHVCTHTYTTLACEHLSTSIHMPGHVSTHIHPHIYHGMCAPTHIYTHIPWYVCITHIYTNIHIINKSKNLLKIHFRYIVKEYSSETSCCMSGKSDESWKTLSICLVVRTEAAGSYLLCNFMRPHT